MIKQQDAGKSGDPCGQNEGGEFVAVGRIAEKTGALLVLANRYQHATDRRVMESP